MGREEGEELGMVKGRKIGEELGMVKGLQLAIINMLQTRFPEITEQAKIKVTQVSNGEQLQHAIIDVTIARDASEVLRILDLLAQKEQ